MKISVLIAALMVLDVGASMRKHHHHHHQKAHHGKMSHAAASQFYRDRNRLNEKEHTSLQMFETLDSKLTDEAFINQAIENNQRLQLDVDGPFNRTFSPFEQFRMGPPAGAIFKNSSSKTVKITTTKTVTTDGSTTVTVRNDTTHGTYTLTEGFEAKKCAEEGQQCNCLGQVHFGKKAGSFAAMHVGNVSIKDTRSANRNGFLACEAPNFNVTNSTGGHECYCVREKAPDPLPAAEHCADDVGMNFCSCYGTVYYGRKEDKETKKALSFAEMTTHGWTSVISNGDLLCDVNSFDGDPDYGHNKQCFCQADPQYEPAPAVQRCALEKDKSDCVCTGTVYYGRDQCPFDHEPLTFLDMKGYSYVSRTVDGAIGCNNFEFGDPIPGAEKACFCEANQEPQVKRCATQDGTCKCNGGNVFYGLLEVDGRAPASFDDMYMQSFAVKYDVTGNVQCNTKTFGFDPQPGKAKQCYCDDIQYEDKECIEAELSYWREQREVTKIKIESETQYTEMTTTISTASKVQEETQLKITEEEERFAKEQEIKLKNMEEERARIQAEMDAKDKTEHEAELALDKQAHNDEIAAKEAEQAAKEAELEAEAKKKDAANADEAAKYQAQLEAQKAAAELADKKRDAEFKQKKADAEAAKLKKQKLQKELSEKNTLAQQELQTIRDARKAQMKAEKQKMRLESQRLLQEYEANRAASEAARTQAAIQKALEQAMEKEMELALKRAEENNKRREKEAKKREEEALKKQKLAEQEEERQRKIEEQKEAELERLADLAKQEEAMQAELDKAAKEEAAKLKEKEEASKKRQRELEDQQLRALRAEAIASTEADIKEAQDLAEQLAQEMEQSRKERQKLLDEKRELIIQKQNQKAKHEQVMLDKAKAEKELEDAKALLKKKKEHAAKLKKETQAFIAKMKEQTAKAQAAAQAQIDKDAKEAQEAKKKREAAAKDAREVDEKAHQAQLKARKELDKLQAEQHKKEMAERKAEFEKTFKHLWGSSATGLSIVYATFVDKATADKVITEAFSDTMIAQVSTTPGVTYEFKNETKLHLTNTGLHVQQNDARVEMITSDDRVPELIETAIAVSGNENLDIIVVSMNSASPDYKKWVQLQSTEQDQTNAYYNVDPFGGEKLVPEKMIEKLDGDGSSGDGSSGESKKKKDKCCQKFES